MEKGKMVVLVIIKSIKKKRFFSNYQTFFINAKRIFGDKPNLFS